MSTIDTVRGPVALDALGQTLAHEHVLFIDSEFVRFYPELAWGGDRSVVVEKVVQKLQDVRDRGIQTILDCTALLHGRDMDFLREVNDRVDLNIIVSTGIYTFDHLPHHIASLSRFTSSSDDILTRMFLRDLTVGVADSGIRAQSIKIAVDKAGFTPNIERIFRAAGKASSETGAPITVHTHPADKQAAQALEILTSEGADASTIVIGHSGDTTDVDYLRSIIDAGAVVGSDRFGLYLIPGTASEDERIDVLKTLAAEGKAARIVLSHDAVLYSDWSEPGSTEKVEALKTWVPTRISDVVLPALRRARRRGFRHRGDDGHRPGVSVHEYRLLSGRLHGRVAIVTGAGNGVGKAIAHSLAAQGASVVVNDLGTTPTGDGMSSDAADATVAEIRSAGGAAVANYDSVADKDGCTNLVMTANEAFGSVDILIANAGAVLPGSFDATDEQFAAVINLVLGQKFWLSRLVVPGMLERGFGRIVMTTSEGARGKVGKPLFGMSMAGTIGMMKGLAHDVQGTGVTVNALAPGAATRTYRNALPALEAEYQRRPPFGRAVAAGAQGSWAGRARAADRDMAVHR